MKKSLKEAIEVSVHNAILATNKLKTPEALNFIEEAAHLIAKTFQSGGKLIIAGNGGSLCDAMHFAEELTAFFRKKRKALPAIVLSEVGHMTAVSNDDGFDQVFARGVEAFGKEEDTFIVLTTSGNSDNLTNAMHTAKEQNLKTIAFLGKTGGALKGMATLEWIVSGFKTSDRIQEVQMAAIHILIEMVEKILFNESEMTLHKKAQKEFLLNK